MNISPSLHRGGLLVVLCLLAAPVFAGTNPAQPNILVVVLDDFGTDMVPGSPAGLAYIRLKQTMADLLATR